MIAEPLPKNASLVVKFHLVMLGPNIINEKCNDYRMDYRLWLSIVTRSSTCCNLDDNRPDPDTPIPCQHGLRRHPLLVGGERVSISITT